MTPVEAIKVRLAACESEHQHWLDVYNEAEQAMMEKLKGYHSHYSEIERLKRALAILEPSE